MKNMILPLLADWNMGVILIGVFALVCVVLVSVVFNLAKSDKKNNKDLDVK